MAQFKNVVPTELKEQLRKDLLQVQFDQGTHRLPDYPTFVNNLAKTMATPGEELHHACTGMSGEAGEALDISKKVWVYGKPLDVRHLIEELGDLRFYYQAALNLLGITDEDVQAQNFQKLRVRYADGKYSDAQAIARADKAPAPLSAEGSKGDAKPEPRKFMGKVSEEQADQQRTQERDRVIGKLVADNVAPVTNTAELKTAVNERFDVEVNRSLRQLRKDEQP